jgi:biuret amidohydrolase
MTPKPAELVAPAHTAIVTQECQGAVIGPHAGLAVLAEEARHAVIANTLSLLATITTTDELLRVWGQR